MFNQILPRQVDNTYRSYKLALWLFGLLVFMKAGISLGTIFNGYNAASSADGSAASAGWVTSPRWLRPRGRGGDTDLRLQP